MYKALQYRLHHADDTEKRRSIKKELLAGTNNFIDKKIAVLGGSTTHDIISIAELFLLNCGIRPTFYESEFGQWWQDAMFCPQELYEFSPDVIFIHTSSRNITKFPAISDSDEQTDKLLNEEFVRFESAWQALKNKFGSVIIIQNNFELPYFRLLGNSDASNRRRAHEFYKQTEHEICRLCGGKQRFLYKRHKLSVSGLRAFALVSAVLLAYVQILPCA